MWWSGEVSQFLCWVDDDGGVLVCAEEGREDDVHVGLSFGYLKARTDIVNISP